MKTDKDAAFETMRKWYQMDDPELMEHFYDDSFVKELDESGYIDSLYE